MTNNPNQHQAAEPVAWRFWDGVSWQLVDYKPDLAAWRKVEPLYPVPPVRGDRQAVLRLLQSSSCFRGDVCASLPCACAESISLPVQSAPDRDTLYAILSQHIPQDMIDGIWQEVQEARK